MNTKRVNTVASVILAALTQNRTAAGIALALESAGMLAMPSAPDDALAKARNEAWRELRRDTGTSRPMWRVVITDSESPTGFAPVCSGERSDALHMIEDYPGGPQRDEDGVYDCCPYPQVDMYSTVWAEYLVGLLNADASDELTGAYLARWEEEQDNARLRLALTSAQRGRHGLRARLAGELRSPLAWARLLDVKSLDNFLMALGMAVDTDPVDGALSQAEEMIRSFRSALPSGAEEERAQTLHDHIMARDAEIERLRVRLAELEQGPALPWAATMPDDDLHGFLDSLVSAAMDRWRSDPVVPDREVLAGVERACAQWRTPGQGYRSDEDEPAEDPCHPCGCPKRFNRHAWGCPTLAEESTLTVFRASHDSIVMGLYATAAEARKHCETVVRREHPDTTAVQLWWREDEDTVDRPEDGEQELWEHVKSKSVPGPGYRRPTGYLVTPLTVASEYDGEADE